MSARGDGLCVLFAPAAAPSIGGGHVMRDLALAEALQASGATTVFAVSAWGERLVRRFADPPPALHPIAGSGRAELIANVIEDVRPHVLVLDDYGLDADATAPLRRPGMVIAAIDDLADRSYACDLLVDAGYGRAASDYAGRVPPGCEVLVGPGHALLRPGFARPARPKGKGKGMDGTVERVFVSFGLSDVDAIAARAVERLRPLAPQARFDVALAADAPSLPRLQALAADDARLALHVDARDMAGLMRAADIAVGAGGSATWERCALGLPTLAVVLAHNQRATIERLAQAGAVLAVDLAATDFDAALEDAFVRLCSPTLRRSLAETSSALCDGHGAGRVAEALMRLAGRPSGEDHAGGA